MDPFSIISLIVSSIVLVCKAIIEIKSFHVKRKHRKKHKKKAKHRPDSPWPTSSTPNRSDNVLHQCSNRSETSNKESGW